MVVTNFLVLPPEVNSARLYVGAGSGSMFAAAAAWEGLANELGSAATSFGSATSGLAGAAWQGPAAVAMMRAAARYVGWLTAAANQAEIVAVQAQAAATAFEAAQAATVHPAAVAANRMQLMTLVATNFLGQNTPAIAATEFEYVEMWAQDVAAMVGYHTGAVSVASMLTPFTVPPKSMARLAGQARRMVAQAAASDPPPADPPPANPPMTPTLQSLVQALASGAQGLATPLSTAISPLMMLMGSAIQGGAQSAGLTGAAGGVPEAVKFVGGALPDVKSLGGGARLGGAGVPAGVGQARLVGALSVPADWAGSTPARMASSAMSGLGAAGTSGAAVMAAAAPSGPGAGMMPMPMGGMGAGGGMSGGMLGRGSASPLVVQSRPSVVPRAGVG
jgi:PPE-repeat protein